MRIDYLTLPPWCSRIGYNAVRDAQIGGLNLEYIEKLDANALNGTKIETIVRLNDAKTLRMDGYAVAGCNSLKNVYLGNGTLDGIGEFRACRSLENAIVDGAKTISASAFQNCSGLKRVYIPEIMTSIGYSVFENCTSLEKIYIPSSVTTISDTAFKGCDKLTLYGEAGSYVETYASGKNIPFQAVDVGEVQCDETVTIEDAHASVTIPYSSACGYFDMSGIQMTANHLQVSLPPRRAAVPATENVAVSPASGVPASTPDFSTPADHLPTGETAGPDGRADVSTSESPAGQSGEPGPGGNTSGGEGGNDTSPSGHQTVAGNTGTPGTGGRSDGLHTDHSSDAPVPGGADVPKNTSVVDSIVTAEPVESTGPTNPGINPGKETDAVTVPGKVANANGDTTSGTQSSISKKETTKMKRPLIQISKKKEKKTRYLQIKMLQYRGKYLQVYYREKAGKYKKLTSKKIVIRKYNGLFRIKYSKRKQTIWLKVRTYKVKKGKRIYSYFSKPKKIVT